MTEIKKSKRFKEVVSIQKIIDTMTDKEYNALVDTELLELLNDLYDENQMLKEYIDFIEKNWNMVIKKMSKDFERFEYRGFSQSIVDRLTGWNYSGDMNTCKLLNQIEDRADRNEEMYYDLLHNGKKSVLKSGK